MPLKKLPLPIGKDDYKKLIDEQCTYVDKTLLIKEFWEDKSEVILVTRPRRFGKTMGLSMLRYFFEKTKHSTSYLFEKSDIWQEPGFSKLQGTFPVIYLSFKEVQEETFESAYEQITELLVEELDRLITPIASFLSPLHKRQYEAFIAQTASPIQFGNSLKFMSKVLEIHYHQKTIILIDEYDTPITHAYLNKYYKKMVAFMKKLLSSGLKGNSHLSRAFLTGVVRTAKDGVLSGLNNPKICTMLDRDFADKFGFTQEEVEKLLKMAGFADKQEEVKSWYNGYICGAKYVNQAQAIYNPWSILQYIDHAGSPETYWANTGSTDILEKLIVKTDERTQEELKILLEGKPLEKKEIDQDVILLNLDQKDVEPWSFLFFAGYITTTFHHFKEDKHYYNLSIPNKEISSLYRKLVTNAISKKFSSHKLESLLKALLKGDTQIVENLLGEFVRSFCSSHDVPQKDLERSLHLFVLGLLVSLSEKYIIESNLESGDGRFDIMLCPKSPADLGILLEFKKGPKKELNALALKALEQIKTKHCKTRLRNLGYAGKIICYAIASYKKELLVKQEILS